MPMNNKYDPLNLTSGTSSPDLGMLKSNLTRSTAPFRSDSTSTIDSDATQENNAMKRQLFKTKICRHHLIGRCKYNDNCFFAHSADQVVRRIDFRRTKLCSKSNCHDQNCLYAHSVEEIRDPYAPLCPDWEQYGECSKGNACMLSHNLTHLEELALSSSSQASKTAVASVAISSKRSSSPKVMIHPSPINSDLDCDRLCELLTPPPTFELNSHNQTDCNPSFSIPAEQDNLLSAEELVQALVQMLSTATVPTDVNDSSYRV